MAAPSTTGTRAKALPDSKELTVGTSSQRKLWLCRFFWALIGFAIINLVAGYTKFAKLPPQDFPEMTWTGWAVQDFLHKPKSADIVFLGSSLMLVPIAGADADYLQKRLDGSQHHQSLYFESIFKQRTRFGASTFNFALPGQMPSDAFLIMHNLLRDSHKPKIVVYGLGPRDFIDNCLPSPAATDPYRSLSRFGGVDGRVAQFMPDLGDQFNFALEKCFYLYGNKVDLCKQALTAIAVEISKLIPLPKNSLPFSIFERHELIPEYKMTELNQGEAFFRPTTAADRKMFCDNLNEYRKRYKTVKWATFNSQMNFLSQLLDEAHARGIHVVLMSMPITDLNRSLLRPEAYETYKHTVMMLGQAKNANYIDLEKVEKFNINDFGDTVHLHARGGMKMLQALSEQLAEDNAVRRALDKRLPAKSSTSKDEHSDNTSADVYEDNR